MFSTLGSNSITLLDMEWPGYGNSYGSPDVSIHSNDDSLLNFIAQPDQEALSTSTEYSPSTSGFLPGLEMNEMTVGLEIEVETDKKPPVNMQKQDSGGLRAPANMQQQDYSVLRAPANMQQQDYGGLRAPANMQQQDYSVLRPPANMQQQDYGGLRAQQIMNFRIMDFRKPSTHAVVDPDLQELISDAEPHLADDTDLHIMGVDSLFGNSDILDPPEIGFPPLSPTPSFPDLEELLPVQNSTLSGSLEGLGILPPLDMSGFNIVDFITSDQEVSDDPPAASTVLPQNTGLEEKPKKRRGRPKRDHSKAVDEPTTSQFTPHAVLPERNCKMACIEKIRTLSQPDLGATDQECSPEAPRKKLRNTPGGSRQDPNNEDNLQRRMDNNASSKRSREKRKLQNKWKEEECEELEAKYLYLKGKLAMLERAVQIVNYEVFVGCTGGRLASEAPKPKGPSEGPNNNRKSPK